jgi:hypothetical protein
MRNKEKGQREPRVVVEFLVVLLANGNLLSRNAEGLRATCRIHVAIQGSNQLTIDV